MRIDKDLLLLVVIGFFAILGSTMSKAPTLPLYARSLGLTGAEIGIVAAASTITGILVNFISGLLSDLYGRKRILLVSGVVFSTAPILYFFARDTFSLTLVRVYYGIATAIFVPVSLALISDLYPSRKGTFMGFLSSSTLIGRALAPLIAGSLIFIIGFSPVFIACAISGIISLTMMIILPREDGRRRGVSRTIYDFVSLQLLPISLIDAVTYMAYQGIETFLPLFQILLGKEWLAGLILTVEIASMAIIKPIAGYLSDIMGRTRPILIGMIMMAISMFILAYVNNIVFIIIGVILFAIAASLTTASTKPLAADIAKYRGAALGMLESIKDVGQASGPILIGVLGTKNGYMIMGGLILIILVVFFISVKSWKLSVRGWRNN